MSTPALSIDAFNVLCHYYSELIPMVELEGNQTYKWVCKFAGMDFDRKLTIGEMMDMTFTDIANKN